MLHKRELTLVKANLGTASANCLHSQRQRTTAEAPYGRFITGSRLSVTYLQARCSLLTNSIMEGAALCSHWNQSLLKICLSGIGCFCQNQMDSQASSFTIWVFYPALLLNGNLILQQMKCGNGLVFMEVTGPVMFPNTLEQPA